MDLRAKIAEALYEAPQSQEGPVARIAHRVAVERAQERADAVMGVIEAEHGGPKCVSADIYDQVCGQMHDAHEEVKVAKGRLSAVRELHALHEKDRDAIDPWCYECNVPYPCPTLRALDGGK